MADRLVRDRAGTYHSPDRRFTVQQEGSAWYLRDASHRDELGQPRLLGPYPSLSAAREAVEAAERVAPRARRRRP